VPGQGAGVGSLWERRGSRQVQSDKGHRPIGPLQNTIAANDRLEVIHYVVLGSKCRLVDARRMDSDGFIRRGDSCSWSLAGCY
jgi:hypothetical protein